jgi:hypothetical protein
MWEEIKAAAFAARHLGVWIPPRNLIMVECRKLSAGVHHPTPPQQQLILRFTMSW